MQPTSQRLPDLLGGVSRQSADRRSRTEVKEARNAFPHPVRGLMKRPPTVHRARLSTSTTPYLTSGLFEINKDLGDRYWMVILDGDLKVFDVATGAEVPVEFPSGKGYLQGPGTGYRTLTLGDTTVVVNTNRVTEAGTRVAPPRKHEAIAFVRQGDFSTTYRLTLDGVAIEYTTPDGTSPQAKAMVETSEIARQIYRLARANSSLAGFQFRRYGSTIHIFRTNGEDFTISTEDGLGDEAFGSAKSSVQRIEDLPERAVQGFTVEVVGDPGTEFDNFWVTYEDGGALGKGVWVETVQPGSLLGFDPSSMPHQLTLTGAFSGRYKISRGSVAAAPRITPTFDYSPTGIGFGSIEYRPVSRETGLPTASGKTTLSFEAVTTEHWPAGSYINFTFEGKNSRVQVPATAKAPGWKIADVITSCFAEVERIVDSNFEVYRDGDRELVIRPLGSNTLAPLLGISAFVPGSGGDPPAYIPAVTVEDADVDLSRKPRILSPGDDAVLSGHGDLLIEQEAEFPTAFHDGTVFFDVDTTMLTQGAELVVRILSQDTVKAEKRYSSGLIKRDESITAPGDNAWLRIQILYSLGEETFRAQPPSTQARVVVRGTDRGLGGICQAEDVGTTIEIPSDAFYPSGSSVFLGPEEAEAPAAGYTPEQMTEALFLLFEDATRLTPTSFSVPTPGLEGGATGISGGVVHIPGASFVPGEHEGHILDNLTDGSSWEIIGNTADTIQLGDLLSGSSDGFERGDLAVVRGTGSTFVFKPMDWTDRRVGDMETNPMPSFLGHPIHEVFFAQGRLGFTSEDRVVLSSSGDLLNFFRASAQRVLDSDPVDIQSATREMSHFHSVVEWEGGIYPISEFGPFLLSGNPGITPESVRLDSIAEFKNTGTARPSVSGSSMVLGRGVNGYAQVQRITRTSEGRIVGEDVTERIAGYIVGSPTSLVTDGSLGIIAVTTDASPRNRIWVLVSRDAGEGIARVNAWCRWELSTGSTVAGMGMLDGQLGLLVVRPGEGTYLETIDLRPVFNPDTEASKYSDRSGHANSAPFDTEIELHPIVFFDERTGDPQPSGKLVVTWVELEVHETTDLTVTVTLPGRSPKVRTFSWETPYSGTVRFPVMGDARTARIVLSNGTAGGSIISSLGWEGHHSVRHRRYF